MIESKLKAKNCNRGHAAVSTLLGLVSTSQKKQRRRGGGVGGRREGGRGRDW